VAQPGAELDQDRTVQSQLVAQAIDRFRCGIRPGDDDRRVAGQQMHQHKGESRDQQQDRNRLRDTKRNEANH
jgi:hypothetical protein